MRRPKANSTPLLGKASLGILPNDRENNTRTTSQHGHTPDAKESAPPSLPMLEYEVVRHRGHWRILHIGKHSVPHDSQDAAIVAAGAQAKESVAQGRLALVRLKRTDGEERLIDLNPPDENKWGAAIGRQPTAAATWCSGYVHQRPEIQLFGHPEGDKAGKVLVLALGTKIAFEVDADECSPTEIRNSQRGRQYRQRYFRNHSWWVEGKSLREPDNSDVRFVPRRGHRHL